MGVKLKLGLGIASLFIGVALLGGTFAIFTDTVEVKNNPIKSGILELNSDIQSNLAFNVTNFAPRDFLERTITLQKSNNSIPISRVLLRVSYSLYEPDGTTLIPKTNNGEMNSDILVTISSGDTLIITEKPLNQLETMGNLELTTNLGSGSMPLKIRLDYNNTVINQNHQQGDKLNIDFIFEAEQRTDSEGH